MATKRLWRWRGIDVQGAPCQGMLWQTKRLEVLQHLQQQRVIPLAVRRCAVKQSLWHPRYSCETIRQLATLLQAGLPLAEGLSLLAQQQSHAQWQALLEALGRELAMISTGELTGKLDICCLQLANQQQEQQRLASKVKKALRYPLIVLSLALLVVLGMLYFVLPEFTAIYQTFSTPLPLLTRMVVAAGDMLSRGWPLLLASLLSPLLLNQLIRRRSDWLLRRQRLLNALPLIGSLIGGQQLSLIFTILALTQSAGISFLQGLQRVPVVPAMAPASGAGPRADRSGGADLAGVKPLRRFYTAVPAAHPHGGKRGSAGSDAGKPGASPSPANLSASR